jgi:hypothetical protein
MSSIESILAEIDSAVAPKASMTKKASSAVVSELAQKLASAAEALERSPAEQATDDGMAAFQSKVAQPEQKLIDKIAEAVVVSTSMSLIGSLPEAVQFAKAASAQGHDPVESFKFFLTQKVKELGL